MDAHSATTGQTDSLSLSLSRRRCWSCWISRHQIKYLCVCVCAVEVEVEETNRNQVQDKEAHTVRWLRGTVGD